MEEKYHPLPPGKVRLLPGLFLNRFKLNRQYMLSLKTENLLQNYYQEAGLWNPRGKPEDCHWGWESPTCQLRGHFLGHWLSAAAWMAANTGDPEVKGKADYIVSELARCQVSNGGEWAGSIPEKYLDWAARGMPVWAPQYTLHKTLMGLFDMYAQAGNQQALDILVRWARWFYRWTGQFTTNQMDDLLDYETGGMLEVWANLYGVTGEKEHYELLQRYDRRRLFDPLLRGKDVLTNMHANTTIPEIHGAARAWEVTGEDRWRDIVEAYWQSAVTERGIYATGGQTNGEIWSPPGELTARLGSKTQEHCTVYNMLRLADYLLRWTGDPAYADYWERGLWNGILAQQNPDTGMIAYFLPLHAGAAKMWGTPTEDFWCCHGTLVQAHTQYTNHIYHTDHHGLVLDQFIPSELAWVWGDSNIQVRLEDDPQTGMIHRPHSSAYRLKIKCDQPESFRLMIRLPWWISAAPEVSVNGEPIPSDCMRTSYLELDRTWLSDVIEFRLPRQLSTQALPDAPESFAFMDGPVVLAGLHPESESAGPPARAAGLAMHWPVNYSLDEIQLRGDPSNPDAFIIPENEREWAFWQGSYRTIGQARNIRLIPLYEVRDERYSVYFSIKS